MTPDEAHFWQIQPAVAEGERIRELWWKTFHALLGSGTWIPDALEKATSLHGFTPIDAQADTCNWKEK